jgi:hypothetical protein
MLGRGRKLRAKLEFTCRSAGTMVRALLSLSVNDRAAGDTSPSVFQVKNFLPVLDGSAAAERQSESLRGSGEQSMKVRLKKGLLMVVSNLTIKKSWTGWKKWARKRETFIKKTESLNGAQPHRLG